MVLFAALVSMIVIVALSVSKLVGSPTLAVLAVVIVTATAVVLWRVGRSQSAAIGDEKQQGYSTLYDFEGYDLRDYRDGSVIRPRQVQPGVGVRRSLVSGMLSVRAGSPLANRLADDAEGARDESRDDPGPT